MNDTLVYERYAPALHGHLRRDRHEQALLEAYELGRELMEAGAGILDVVRLHAEADGDLDLDVDPATAVAARLRSINFLAEVLAPFEMAYLGYKDANDSLRRLTTSLEEQVDERTRQLQGSLQALQAADEERRRLLERVVSAEEEERHRIADDLHDDTIQIMTAVALRLSILSDRLREEDSVALERLESQVSDTIGRLRRLMFELRPPALDHEGLAAAIRMYLQLALEDGPEYRVRDRLKAQPPVQSREIAYRIAQEALANVRKHARARHVDIGLDTHRGGVRVTITDDGDGFDTRVLHRSRPGHLGMTAMRERAGLAGGWYTVDSKPGHGTTVTFWLPERPEDRDS